MKIFTGDKIRQLDELTIKNEAINSVDLMERAAQSFVRQFCELFENNTEVCVVCGSGNNGGDALAIARMLSHLNYRVSIYLYSIKRLSEDCSINRKRFISEFPDILNEQFDNFSYPTIQNNQTVIIDGLFGSGFSRPLSGFFSELVRWINNSGLRVVSIDIPSGMYCEDNQIENELMVKANYTLTFQFPKLAFLLPESGRFAGNWYLLDIGLNNEAINATHTEYFFIDKSFVTKKLKYRSKFSHKGTYGHVLLIAGSKGMAGASVLAANSALRSGAGLVTLHGPECNRNICQTSLMELIFSSDKNNDFLTGYPELKNYTSIGVGCGIGNAPETAIMLEKLFTELFSPCVVDADALNIISRNKHFMDLIPENSILTPHPKEFDRLFGINNTTWQRIQKAREIAMRYRILVVLKGAHSVVVNVDGNCYFNSSGNNGMATAGSGDVLTGLLTSLLAQGYSSLDAACLGVFLHGLAADIALSQQSHESLIAGDIARNFGKAFDLIRKA